MMQETERNLLSQKLTAYSAISLSGDNKELKQSLIEIWDKIIALTYGSDMVMVKPLTEQLMREEYEHIKKIKPEFKINKATGEISIKGLTK